MKIDSPQLFSVYPVVFLCLLNLAFGSVANAGKLYKWIDENGQVRYTDHMPQSAVNSNRQTLNEQGLVIDSKEAAKTPEEYSALRKAEKERQQKLKTDKLEVEKNRKRDRALLLTFSSEEELSLAKDERMVVVDSVVRLIYKSMAISQKKLIELEILAQENYTSKGLAVPGGLAQRIEVITRKNITREKQLRRKLEEKNRIDLKYEIDLARYRELKPSQ